ncbi:MAG TPA: hypothetical protein VFB12_19430, partial [Ktedonobacteraceae bacterium]|nr:hypothetical protein [Ktedonobacteraceae bacterium]
AERTPFRQMSGASCESSVSGGLSRGCESSVGARNTYREESGVASRNKRQSAQSLPPDGRSQPR